MAGRTRAATPVRIRFYRVIMCVGVCTSRNEPYKRRVEGVAWNSRDDRVFRTAGADSWGDRDGMTPAEHDAPFIALHAISKHFGGVRALAGVDLAIRPGEVHGVIGENGSGKSTLIKIMSGSTEPDPGGRIEFDGQPVAGLTAHAAVRRGVQVIYQDLSLFPNLSVAENIGFSEHLRRPITGLTHRARLRAVARQAMQRVGVALPLEAPVGTLSIANRQLVAICRALAAEARLVIMDEPTASLTRHEVEALLRIVADLRARAIATLFVSHRLDEVTAIADRVTILRDGRRIDTVAAAGLSEARLAFLMTGLRTDSAPLPRRVATAQTPRLQVQGLSRAGGFADVSFSVAPGEIVGLTGRLGAGRTELALCLFGIDTPDAGRIVLDGETIALASNRDAVARGIAYVPEDRLALGLVLDHAIADNITLAILGRLVSHFGLIDLARQRASVAHWIAALRIKAPAPADAVATLSGGNQQRVVLAKWLATRPRLLILDSPTVGVDIAAKQGIYQIVEDLAAQGVGIILISDEIPEVLHHSHRVLLLRAGRIVAEYDAATASAIEIQDALDA